jgi:hypothetical protein
LQDYWTPQFQAWLHFVFYELSGRLEDPAYREELRQVPVDKTRHPEVYVCEYYAVLGSCFKNGLMQRKIFLANGSFDTVCAWSRLRVPIALMREAAFPTQYKDFEDLASLCRDWLQAHGLRWEDVA